MARPSGHISIYNYPSKLYTFSLLSHAPVRPRAHPAKTISSLTRTLQLTLHGIETPVSSIFTFVFTHLQIPLPADPCYCLNTSRLSLYFSHFRRDILFAILL